jgi:hypothetical protein
VDLQVNGLLDEGGFPGMPYAHRFEWGAFGTPTVARDHRVVSNRISHFLEQLWDGGNIFYTDGGSRYATFDQNVSLANPVGFIDLGGAEMGGCVPRGHLTYTDNWFTQPITFFDNCLENLDVPVGVPDVSIRNHAILDEADVPAWILA